MATTVDIGTLIYKRPGFRGGDACIAGTGLRVKNIVGWYKAGYTPDEIADGYDHISLAHVHAALAYYHANREEIEALFTEDDQTIEDLKRAVAAGDPSIHPFPG